MPVGGGCATGRLFRPARVAVTLVVARRLVGRVAVVEVNKVGGGSGEEGESVGWKECWVCVCVSVVETMTDGKKDV